MKRTPSAAASRQSVFSDFYAREAAPISGRTAESWAASASGAAAVDPTWTLRQQRYLDLLKSHGPINDFDAAAQLGCGPNSINSVRNALRAQVVPDGADPYVFIDLTGVERHTQRTRWRLR